MPEILMNVVNKIPQLTGDVRQITSGNGDYTVRLIFDDDWADGEKTVLFVRENGFAYPAVRTENDCCAVPEVNGVPLREWLYIGVKQGDVHTSRPCGIPVYRSIDDMISDEAVQPDPSLWDDILTRLIAVEENVDEVVAETVEEYLRENPIGVPTKLSELENDTGFITRLVNDLANYYRKSETYTREEVDGKISAIPKFSIAVVDALPTANISVTTVYLVRSGDDTGDLYTEYIYVDGKWEILGSQRVDLTGYVTDAELTDALKEYAKLTDISVMTGATAEAQGKSGMVPAPAAGQQDYVLHGDGTWRGIEIPEIPESVPPGNLAIVVMGESLDELTIVSVQYPADAPEGYQPEDSIAAGNVVVMLVLVDQNGEDIAAMSMGVPVEVGGGAIQTHMNLVQEDAVTSLLLEADLASMTARALVYTEFAGGGAPEASGWVEILPETVVALEAGSGMLPELDVSAGDVCRLTVDGMQVTVTAFAADVEGAEIILITPASPEEAISGNFVGIAVSPERGWSVVRYPRADSVSVKLEKSTGDIVTRAEFDALVSRTIPTYVLAEGETPEDAPEWAEEVIDPYNDPEGGGYVLTDADKQEIAEIAAGMVDVPEGGGGSGEWEVVGKMSTDVDVLQMQFTEPPDGRDFADYTEFVVFWFLTPNSAGLSGQGTAIAWDLKNLDGAPVNIAWSSCKSVKIPEFKLVAGDSDVGQAIYVHLKIVADRMGLVEYMKTYNTSSINNVLQPKDCGIGGGLCLNYAATSKPTAIETALPDATVTGFTVGSHVAGVGAGSMAIVYGKLK